MACVAHDLLVGHTISIGRRDEASPQTVRTYRLGGGALHSGPRRSRQEVLTHSTLAEGARLDAARLVHLPEHRPELDRGRIQPPPQRPDRAGVLVAAEDDHDLGAFAVLVGL